MINYTNFPEDELLSLKNLLLSPEESNVHIALEIIKHRGFHVELERPLALIHYLKPNFEFELLKKIKHIYGSRMSVECRISLKRELYLIDAYDFNHLGDLTPDLLQAALDSFMLLYTPFLKGHSHLLAVLDGVSTALWQAGWLKYADQLMQFAIQQGTTLQNTYFNLGLLHQNELNNLKIAEKAYTQALELDALDYVAHNNLAQVFEKIGEIEKASDHLIRALQLQPTYVHSLVNLAYLRWRHQENFEEARDLYQQALQIEPYDTYALCNFADLLMQHFKEFDKAKELLELTLEVDEEDSFAYSCLGNLILYLDAQNKKEALHYYEKALYYDPSDQEKVQDKIKQLKGN